MPKQSEKSAAKPTHDPASAQRMAGDQQAAAETESLIEDHRDLSPAQARVQRVAESAAQRQIGVKATQLAAHSTHSNRDQQKAGSSPITPDAGVTLKINAEAGSQSEQLPAQREVIATAIQRALIVGSHNEKYDINDMGLWWTMACEHKNAQHEGFEAVILTLKDFDRDYDQEFEISVNDKVRFITHGYPGGTSVDNEKEGGGYQKEEWADIESKILTQIEVFNAEQEQIATESLLKPYFCFMKENRGLMDAYQGELGDIGEGPVFLTNKFVLALDMAKIRDASSMATLGAAIGRDAELSQLFTRGAGWKSFPDVAAHLPLLKDYKTKKADSVVNHGDMYDEIYAFIEPRYQKLVDLVGDFITGNKSAKAPWENLRQHIDASVDDKDVVEES